MKKEMKKFALDVLSTDKSVSDRSAEQFGGREAIATKFNQDEQATLDLMKSAGLDVDTDHGLRLALAVLYAMDEAQEACLEEAKKKGAQGLQAMMVSVSAGYAQTCMAVINRMQARGMFDGD